MNPRHKNMGGIDIHEKNRKSHWVPHGEERLPFHLMVPGGEFHIGFLCEKRILDVEFVVSGNGLVYQNRTTLITVKLSSGVAIYCYMHRMST